MTAVAVVETANRRPDEWAALALGRRGWQQRCGAVWPSKQ
jgi:hypothetical protein